MNKQSCQIVGLPKVRQMNAELSERNSIMKTASNVRRSIVFASLALALVGLILAPGIASAQPKGAQKLIEMTTLKTAEDLQTIEPGDMIVMSCPKCKTTSATVVEKTFKAAHPEDLKTIEIHLCPSCNTKIVTKGHGKQAKDVLVHTCKTCGSKDAFCCVMKKGSVPTEGMTEKK
jgi:hypothetical protein